MSATNSCPRCDNRVEDNHRLCRVCRDKEFDGDDDEPPAPGVAQPIQPEQAPGLSAGLAPTAEPNHTVAPRKVTA